MNYLNKDSKYDAIKGKDLGLWKLLILQIH